ncbi:MAG: homoserine dehydrogenase [Thermoflexales bacterium]|nr:homoserine dehydrogenase [Thermoflexales bacterium]
MQAVRLLLVGLGNLGWRFCELLAAKGPEVESRYGLRLLLVGVADSQGTAYNPDGLDPARVAAVKKGGGSAADLPEGRPGERALALIARAEADVLCEASPVNLRQGAEPGLSHVRAALERGMHVVTPNKGPLVLAYRELHDLAARHGAQLRFDGTVAGGLPALYIGQRDLRGATVHRIEAVSNLCTGYVLELLADGLSWDEAQARAREEGVLEADPSFDLEGWDAAAKLVILVNGVMEYPARLEEVERTGITALSGADVVAARREGRVYKLLATADRLPDGSVAMRVAPTPLLGDHFLARLGRKQMGVVYHTDIYGTIMAAIDEPTPLPSAATMLRDILDIYR